MGKGSGNLCGGSRVVVGTPCLAWWCLAKAFGLLVLSFRGCTNSVVPTTNNRMRPMDCMVPLAMLT